MVSWVLIAIGLFLIVTCLYYVSSLKRSSKNIEQLKYYLDLHSEHLKNLNNGEFDRSIADKIITKRILIKRLCNSYTSIEISDLTDQAYIQDQILKLNDAYEIEKLENERQQHPMFAIQKTLSIPANFLNLIFPVKGMFKNLINLLF